MTHDQTKKHLDNCAACLKWAASEAGRRAGAAGGRIGGRKTSPAKKRAAKKAAQARWRRVREARPPSA